MSFTLRSFAVATALTLSIPLALLASTPSGAATSTIPECPPVAKTATGPQSEAIYQDNNGGTWDLTGAVWQGSAAAEYPIRSDNWTDGCVSGGTVRGPIDPDATRDQWYNDETHGGKNHEAIRFNVGSGEFAVIRDLFASDVEDGIDTNGATANSKTYVDGVHLENIRDDCIENEQIPHDMYVTDSLFDGCFAAFAEKPDSSSADEGTTDADFIVEDSLIYVSPQPLGDRYCSSTKVSQGRCIKDPDGSGWLGNYGFFKWGASGAANVEIRNTILRIDLPSYSSCTGNRFLDNSTFENVTLVYTGPGTWAKAGGCSNIVPPGMTVTSDVSVWDNAKAAWLDGSSTAPPAEEPPAEEPPAEEPPAEEPPAEEPTAVEPPAEEPSNSDAAIADALARLDQAQSALDRAAVEVAAIERLLQDMQSSA